MEKRKIKKRQAVKTGSWIVLAIGVIFLCIGFFSGAFNTNCTKTDIISLKPHHIVSQGEHWALSSRERETPIYGSILFQATPYLIYQGNTEQSPGKSVDVRGVYMYHNKMQDGKESALTVSLVDSRLVMDRHFVIGEKRWFYTTDHTDEVIDKAFLKVTWKQGGESHWEYIVSDELTEQEKKECREWIESGKTDLERGQMYLARE